MYLDPAVSTRRPLAEALTRLVADLDPVEDVAGRSTTEALTDVLQRLRAFVPGALVAGLAWRRTPEEPVTTAAATDDLARALERRQLDLREGPTAEALRGETVVVADAGLGHRWPEFAVELDALRLNAVLALPLPGLAGRGSLTLYAGAAFPPEAAGAAAEAAAVAAAALTALLTRERAQNLDVALASSRQIAAAVGIVMAQQRCGYDDAFALIRSVSQRSHRKIRELAEEVVLTGELPALDGSLNGSPNGSIGGPVRGSVSATG